MDEQIFIKIDGVLYDITSVMDCLLSTDDHEMLEHFIYGVRLGRKELLNGEKSDEK